MCYSPLVSMVSFTVSLLGSLLLYATYDKVLALFFIWVSLMQLYDWVFWHNQAKTRTNYWTTKIAMITNNLQPIILALLIVYLGRHELTYLNKILVCLYSIVALIYIIYSWNRIDYTLPSPICNGGLYWQWNTLPWYWLVYSFFLITMISLFVYEFKSPLNIILVFLCVITYLYSSLFYWKNNMTGRIWCWIAGFIPMIVYIYYRYRSS